MKLKSGSPGWPGEPLLRQSLENAYRKILETHDRLFYKGFKIAVGDMNEWAMGLSKAEIAELNELLMEKFGEDLKRQKTRDAEAIKRIIKRGKIRDADEYRFVVAWVDLNQDDPSQAGTVEIMDKMMAECDVVEED